jgi:folate-dependent phosphoribosylglycinamide formyltransferase PurN
MKWAALFSQTGSEICNLSEKFGRYPDAVISDNVDANKSIDPRIELNCKKLYYRKYKGLTKEAKVDYYKKYLSGFDIITLHGWLNIVPAEVCNEFDIYNGHPGLINYYPELKGKDPQLRAWDNINDYQFIGSVIHRVTPGVDEGPIMVYKMAYSNCCTDLDSIFNALKQTSLDSWIDFLDNYIKIEYAN